VHTALIPWIRLSKVTSDTRARSPHSWQAESPEPTLRTHAQTKARASCQRSKFPTAQTTTSESQVLQRLHQGAPVTTLCSACPNWRVAWEKLNSPRAAESTWTMDVSSGRPSSTPTLPGDVGPARSLRLLTYNVEFFHAKRGRALVEGSPEWMVLKVGEEQGDEPWGED
jgi:hypothetical protein